jgi:hypothetical protein
MKSKKTVSDSVQLLAISLLLYIIPGMAIGETVSVFCNPATPQHTFAAGDIQKALEAKNFTVEIKDLSTLTGSYTGKKVVIALASNTQVTALLAAQGGSAAGSPGEQAYALRTTTVPQLSYWVLGGDDNGAMYGGLQIAENIQFNGFGKPYSDVVSPRILRRGAKLNFAFDERLPTYSGRFHTSSAMSVKAVWDKDFWMEWIDEQARNRYNLLTVWIHNPFPALVTVPGFENATLPYIKGPKGYDVPGGEKLTIEKRIIFWKEVMQYAHQRGFDFYFFNWNVCPDYAKDQYSLITDSQKDEGTKKYFNSAIKELMETYPDLDGFGVSAGDHTGSNKKENADWIYDAYSQGISDFAKDNPGRKFTLVHRLIKVEYKDVKNKWKEIAAKYPNMQFDYSMKYCNANTYSTTTPETAKGDLEELAEDGASTWITLRNDGFFYSDFGHPQFVRDFIGNLPSTKYTDGPHKGKDRLRGIYLGHDAYSPTRSYFHKDDNLNNIDGTKKPMLEIQRKWYLEKLWGRIAYDVKTSDDVFKGHLALRYPQLSSSKLFEAWSKASGPTCRIEELVQGTWNLDSEFYSELCMWRDNGENYFRTIEDFSYSINEKDGIKEKEYTEVAKGSESRLASIKETAEGKANNRITSYKLADEIEQDAMDALKLIASMNSGRNARVDALLKGLQQQAILTVYYAYKIRGATDKEAGKDQAAKDAMGRAFGWWMHYVDLMDAMYIPDQFRTYDLEEIGWHFWDKAVLKEYHDLGGSGIPPLATLPVPDGN